MGQVIGYVLMAVVALGVIASVLWLIIKALRNRRYARESASWPNVLGRIISSRVVSSTIEGASTMTTNYHPEIKYTYEVGGKVYAGERISFGLLITDLNPANAAVSKYPAGSEVKVTYDPSNPSVAVLEPGKP